MININIALLLIAGAFVLGWYFEGMWLRFSSIKRDAKNWRDLLKQEEQAAADLAEWKAQQEATTTDW